MLSRCRALNSHRIRGLNILHKQMSDSVESYKTKLEAILGGMFRGESSGHDLDHLKRVYNLARHIQEKEGGNEMVIGISAFVHDLHRLMQNERGKFVSPKDSLPEVENLLRRIDFPKEKISM